jgi:outer membrane cobalamin receptor
MPCRIFGSIPRLFLSLSTVILLTSGVAFARQASTSSAAGVVADSQGATIARAIVRLLDARRHEVRATLTDDAGRFAIDTAGCAGCRVEVSLPGFTTASATPGPAAMRLVLTLAPVRESVIVTATRDAVPGSQVGATTTVIDSAEIARRGVALVSELLRDVPGLTVVQSGGPGGVTSVFARAGESNYNKVLLDGIPLNEPGGTFNFSTLTTGNLDRIEIVRGAQSALFGSDAMSSVIQLFTKRGSGPGGPPHGDATIERGGYGTVRGGGEVRGESGRVDYSLHASGLGTDNPTPNGRFTNSTFSWNGGAVIRPGLSLRTVGRTEWSRAGTPGQTAFGRPDLDAFFQRHDTVGGATLEHERGPFKGRLTYAYSTSDQISANLTVDPPYTPQLGTNIGVFPFSDFLFDGDNTLNRHRVSYQGDLRLGGLGRLASMQVLTGAVDYDGERATLRDRRAGTTVLASRNNVGVTLQYQAVSSRVSLVAGVRAEDNASFGTVGVPRVSVSGLLRRSAGLLGDTKLKFNAGLGVKEPTILQSFSPNAFFLGNPNLLAERARTIDVGVEQRLAGDRAKVDVVWFDNRYRNQIATETTDFTTFAAQYFNIGLTTARGLELSAETAPLPALRLKGGYTFTDSRIVDSTNAFSPVFAVGQPAFRRPRHAGFAQVAWEHKAVAIDVTGTFVGRRTDSDFFALGTPITSDDPYAIWTLGGHYRPTARVDLFLRVENLTDKDYMEPLGYQAWRRTVHVGLRIGF